MSLSSESEHALACWYMSTKKVLTLTFQFAARFYVGILKSLFACHFEYKNKSIFDHMIVL